MAEDLDREAQERRDFLKKAGKLAVAAPAVGLLLSAAAKPAAASGRYGGGDCWGTHDRTRYLEREQELLDERRFYLRRLWTSWYH